MKLYLAPMEGVVDYHLREILTAIGGIDTCVTEFIRVSEQPLPNRVFRRFCPEIEHGCQTQTGVPVHIQLLGNNPETMAISAARAANLGTKAIDLNFGCPAKTVNRSRGGAVLLKEPKLIQQIVMAVRQAVPKNVAVTAKIRLGFEDKSRYLDNAQAIAEGGANRLFVHARTKVEGYKPPAYWQYIAKIREMVNIPVVANGEIWTVADWQRCKVLSGCDDFMLGRGLIATPDLALQIHSYINNQPYEPMAWSDILPLLYQQYQKGREVYGNKHLGNRVKQWALYLRRGYPQAHAFLESIKRLRTEAEFNQIFKKLSV